jgi:hypothetical protein
MQRKKSIKKSRKKKSNKIANENQQNAQTLYIF